MSLPLTSEPRPGTERVSELRDRIKGMQRDHWESQGTPVSDGLAVLVAHGMLQRGAVYTIDNSPSLIMAILGAVTADGGWSAVIGLPDFGAEAAIGFGIDLDRLVLVPSPGDQWLAVTAALVDVLPFVVVRPERSIGTIEVARLGARLRQTGCTLLVAGAWPQSEGDVHVTATRWNELGAGHGALSGRELTVAVRGRTGNTRARSEVVHLPDRCASSDRPAPSSPARSSSAQFSSAQFSSAQSRRRP